MASLPRAHTGSARASRLDLPGSVSDILVPLVADPEKLILVVAGGDGRHASWFPAWSATQRAIEVIEEPGSGVRG
jgi:hypothetical protein